MDALTFIALLAAFAAFLSAGMAFFAVIVGTWVTLYVAKMQTKTTLTQHWINNFRQAAAEFLGLLTYEHARATAAAFTGVGLTNGEMVNLKNLSITNFAVQVLLDVDVPNHKKLIKLLDAMQTNVGQLTSSLPIANLDDLGRQFNDLGDKFLSLSQAIVNTKEREVTKGLNFWTACS